MNSIDQNKINRFVLRKQHLADDSKIDDIVQVIKDIGGLHAQVPTTPYLSLFERTNNFTKRQLDYELYVKKNLCRIKCIRRTLHIFPRDMISVAFASTKRMLEPLSTRYTKQLGLTKEEYEEISKRIAGIVYGRGLTSKEITNELKSTLNISLIINLMCDQGLLIRGIPKAGWRSNVHTYYLFSEYFSDVDLNEVNEVNARNLMVEHYLASFGPVTENDIVWWTGFPKREIRLILESIQDKITRLELPDIDETYFILCSDKKLLESEGDITKQTVNLLPVLDPYLMGYKERKRYLDYKYYDTVFDFNGNATSTILLNGRVVGVWDFENKARPFVKLFFFEKIERNALKEIHFKAEKIGKFIADKEVQIKECKATVPLTQRTAGGFMSPLKEC